MVKGNSVREHVMMIHLMDQLTMPGVGIVAKAKIDIILYSLPKSFKDFRLNAVMYEKLITVEGVLVLKAQVFGFAKNIFLYRKVKKMRVLRARKRRQIVGATVLALLVGLYNHQ